MCYRWPTEEIPAWSLTQLEGEGASMKLTTEYPLNSATPTALKVTLPAEGRVAIGNTGFWGMNIEEGKDYYRVCTPRTVNASTVKLSSGSSEKMVRNSVTVHWPSTWPKHGANTPDT